MTAVRQYLSDQQLAEERISEQAKRLMQYFEDQNGKDFDPGKILRESAANVISRIAFGKHLIRLIQILRNSSSCMLKISTTLKQVLKPLC